MTGLKRYPLPYEHSKKLVHAVIAGDLQVVQEIVPENVDVNQSIIPYPGGVSTYLSFLAVDHNQPDVLRYLMDIGLDATVKDHGGMNLFCKVASMPHASKELTGILFNKTNAPLGSLLNDQTKSGNTAVHLAVNNLYTLSTMLDMSDDLRVATIRNSKSDTPLAFAIKSARGNPVVPSMLVKYAKEVSQEPFSTTDRGGYTVLELANMYNLPSLVEEIKSPRPPRTRPKEFETEEKRPCNLLTKRVNSDKERFEEAQIDELNERLCNVMRDCTVLKDRLHTVNQAKFDLEARLREVDLAQWANPKDSPTRSRRHSSPWLD